MKKMICKICSKEIPFDNEQKCRSSYTIKISSGYPGKSIKTHCCSECYPLLLGFLNIHDKKSDYKEKQHECIF